MPDTPRPLRADAERNRQAIICAAGSVFAERGTDVTLEQIAQTAGVGVGTIYRRFSSVDDLVTVVLEEKMRRYADRTEDAATRATSTPWEAFSEWVQYTFEQQAADLAFSAVLVSARPGSELFQTERRRAFRASVKLVNRALMAGAIRPDFDHGDLLMMQYANAGLIAGSHRSAPDAWRRFADYVLQSFRHTREPLTSPPIEWVRNLDRALSPLTIT